MMQTHMPNGMEISNSTSQRFWPHGTYIKELSADCIFNIAPILHNEIFDLKLEIHIIKYVCHLSTYLHNLIWKGPYS